MTGLVLRAVRYFAPVWVTLAILAAGILLALVYLWVRGG